MRQYHLIRVSTSCHYHVLCTPSQVYCTMLKSYDTMGTTAFVWIPVVAVGMVHVRNILALNTTSRRCNVTITRQGPTTILEAHITVCLYGGGLAIWLDPVQATFRRGCAQLNDVSATFSRVVFRQAIPTCVDLKRHKVLTRISQ